MLPWVMRASRSELFRKPAVGAVLLGAAVAVAPASAQLLPPPKTGFQPIYYEDSWDDPSAAGVSAPLKNMKLDEAGRVLLDLGGGLRERGEAYRNSVFGIPEAGGVRRDGFLLHRLLINANLRVGDRFRAFVQLGNAAETGRSPAALPTDRNRGDLAQAFAEINLPTGSAELGVRGGRQEMTLGSSRLVDIREGPNVRQRFDGVRGWVKAGDVRADLFWTRPVENRPGWLDDRSDPAQEFYGVYAAAPVAALPGLKIGAYAYRLNREGAMLDAGTADERRNTYGLRFSGKAGAVDYDFEATRQTGRFGERHIDAYALFSDTGYTLANVALKPRLALKAEAISGGNSRGTGDLGTFYPLFPKLNEINEANIESLSNFIRLFPNATIQPRPGLALMAGVGFQWRENLNDSFYQPPAKPILPGNANRRRRLGTVLVAQMEWQATPNLNINASAVHFITEGYLQAAGARDQSWVGLWGTFRF